VLVLVICVLVFTVFCIVYTVSLYCFFYVYGFVLVLSVLPPSDNSSAVTTTTTTTNNNNKILYFSFLTPRMLQVMALPLSLL
jgi:hypothetical protein